MMMNVGGGEEEGRKGEGRMMRKVGYGSLGKGTNPSLVKSEDCMSRGNLLIVIFTYTLSFTSN